MQDYSNKVTLGVLDFYQENESRELLNSLKSKLDVKVHILFIDNGTPKPYSKKFLDEGLVDELVVNEKNTGCGPATVPIQ